MTTEASLVNEFLAAALVMVPMTVVFAVCEWLHHVRNTAVETTRKISHVSGGIAVLVLPWVAGTHWTVLGIALTFALLLCVTKKLQLLPSIHSVARKTRGAEYYPIAVYLIYVLSAGDPLLYSVPILVMAFSDTGAAVVGQRYGLVSYRVIDGFRSLGGSVTFFGLTFALVLMGLGIAGYGDLPSVLLVTLLTALIATAVEGISVRGSDNLLVPYATWLVLRHALELDRDGLGLWVMGTAITLAILLATFRQARLNATAIMAAFVAGSLTFGLGGPLWFAILCVPYLLYSSTRPLMGNPAAQQTTDMPVLVSTFSVSLLLVLAFGHTEESLLFVPFAASVTTVAAIVVASVLHFRGFGNVTVVMGGALGSMAALIPIAFADFVPVPWVVLAPLSLLGGIVGPIAVHGFRGMAWSPSLARFGGVLLGTSTAATWVVSQFVG
jgi:phytol kinase